MDLRAYLRHQARNCTCDGYDDHELKELKDGRVVKIITCRHCFRVKKRIYYKKEKPCKP